MTTTPRKRRILCLCDPRPGRTSAWRLEAFRRLGQEVIPFDVPAHRARFGRWIPLAERLLVGPFIAAINRDLLLAVRDYKPDVVWFDKPTHFTRSTIREIQQAGALTVSYMQDAPFGPRNDPFWYQFRRVFRLFDLHCLFREADVARYRAWGLNYIKTMFSFEPSMQFPPPPGWDDSRRDRHISYIGSAYDRRPQFLRRLLEEHHLPVAISGPLDWRQFLPPDLFERHFLHGPLWADDYRKAIWNSRINLSFVTTLNEDDIAHKSVEIAACQGFLLALRTPGHQAIFEEDREAVFFSSFEECADKCRFYLGRPDLRDAIAARGRERAVRSGYDNDTQLARILNRLDGKQEN